MPSWARRSGSVVVRGEPRTHEDTLFDELVFGPLMEIEKRQMERIGEVMSEEGLELLAGSGEANLAVRPRCHSTP